MRVTIVTHSVESDWNHGNAHFLRGIGTEFVRRGDEVTFWEPADGWSRENLIRDHGQGPIGEFRSRFPHLKAHLYREETLDLSAALDGADAVLVHEWNSPDLVARIGDHHRRNPRYRLFFHDTHHRIVSAPSEMSRYDLSAYDGVLAFGDVIRERYLDLNAAKAAWTWHEAADTSHFRPIPGSKPAADLVWIGNWGDDERAAEIREFLIEPVKRLRIRAHVYGVRYPEYALAAFDEAGIEYHGWAPNFRVPELFAKHRVTIHIPRGPYVRLLPGIPTIRVFEALACGIPLLSAPWSDREGLFPDGCYRTVRNAEECALEIEKTLTRPAEAAERAEFARESLRSRHTCTHRVDELRSIVSGMEGRRASCESHSLVQA